MKKFLAFLLPVIMLCVTCAFPAQAANELTVERVIAVSRTQIVVEFSEPIAFNQNGNNRGPWMTIRAVDSKGESIWGQGPRDDKCIQFTGSYEFLDESYDRVLWTIDLGSCYDNPSIESIMNYEGDMKQWSNYRIVFHIEEVPYDQSNPGKSFVDNITTADAKVSLSGNNPSGSWASVITDIEMDYNYDLGLDMDPTKGTQEIVVNELTMTEVTEYAEEKQSVWLPVLTGFAGAALGTIAGLLIGRIRKQKKVQDR